MTETPQKIITQVFPLPQPGDCVLPTFGIDDTSAWQLAEKLRFDPNKFTVRSMMNQSLDGAAFGSDITSATLSNEVDFFFLTILRALADVLVVGANTARVEGYRRPAGRQSLRSSTASLRPGGAEYPALVLLTNSGDIPANIDPAWPTFLVTARANFEQVAAKNPNFSRQQIIAADTPAKILDFLQNKGFKAVQIEGGPSVLGQFMESQLVDELVWTYSAVTVGSPAPRVVNGGDHATAWNLQQMFISKPAVVSHYRRS